MCGIAGTFQFGEGVAANSAAIVARLNMLQSARGPDGEGLWTSPDGRVVLGHRRLAIIDLSAGGMQPMTDVTGRWTISFNGEIYNYRAVRQELEAEGLRFLTNSDTEVLVASVARWGIAGLRKVRGMFAFALWDNQERELWLARDPYGIKPLYYGEQGGSVWFASQARHLVASAPLDHTLNPAALTSFYLWGFVPEPITWWNGASMLPAGTVLRVRQGRPLARPETFHCLAASYNCVSVESWSDGDLLHAVRDSVRHHMVADTEVGVFLSAGVDSSVLAALACELGGTLRTVTLAFDEYRGTGNDEAPLAEQTARTLGTDHVTVRIGRDEFESLIDSFFAHMDQPSIDGLNMFLVSRAASTQGLKVALSGLGGDELFRGYPSFTQVPFLARMGNRLHRTVPYLPTLARSVEKAFGAIRCPLLSPKVGGLLRYSRSLESAYFLRRALHLEVELDELIDESWYTKGIEQLQTEQALSALLEPLRLKERSGISRISALESLWYMRNQLLRDADWASMAHGLEVRVPFVDVGLLQSMAPMIASNNPPGKSDLARCAPSLGSQLAERQKTGFTTPVRSWLTDAGGRNSRGLSAWADQVTRLFRASHRAECQAAIVNA